MHGVRCIKIGEIILWPSFLSFSDSFLFTVSKRQRTMNPVMYAWCQFRTAIVFDEIFLGSNFNKTVSGKKRFNQTPLFLEWHFIVITSIPHFIALKICPFSTLRSLPPRYLYSLWFLFSLLFILLHHNQFIGSKVFSFLFIFSFVLTLF